MGLRVQGQAQLLIAEPSVCCPAGVQMRCAGLSLMDQRAIWNCSPWAPNLLVSVTPSQEAGVLVANSGSSCFLRDQEDEANGTLMKFREKTKLGGVANTMEEGDAM